MRKRNQSKVWVPVNNNVQYWFLSFDIGATVMHDNNIRGKKVSERYTETVYFLQNFSVKFSKIKSLFKILYFSISSLIYQNTKNQKIQKPSWDQATGKQALSYTAKGGTKWYNSYREQLGNFCKK